MSIKQGLKKLGDMIVNVMRSNAPKDSGRLKDSIHVSNITDNEQETVLTISMEGYGASQDAGVKGTQNVKGVANAQSFFKIGQFSKKFKMVGGDLPVPVRISILRNGLAPQPFVKPSIEKVIQGAGADILAQAGAQEIVASAEGALKDVTIKA
jgi:hypothetical protein